MDGFSCCFLTFVQAYPVVCQTTMLARQQRRAHTYRHNNERETERYLDSLEKERKRELEGFGCLYCTDTNRNWRPTYAHVRTHLSAHGGFKLKFALYVRKREREREKERQKRRKSRKIDMHR